jgi:hypothetical protein
LHDVAVRRELDHRRRGLAAAAARRVEGGAFLVVGEGARPLDDPDMVLRIHRHPGHLAQDPVVGQRLRPERIDLEVGRSFAGKGAAAE